MYNFYLSFNLLTHFYLLPNPEHLKSLTALHCASSITSTVAAVCACSCDTGHPWQPARNSMFTLFIMNDKWNLWLLIEAILHYCHNFSLFPKDILSVQLIELYEKFINSRGLQISPYPRLSHVQILGTIRVTWGPTIHEWPASLTITWPFLLGVCACETFLNVRNITAVFMQKVLGVTVKIVVAHNLCTPDYLSLPLHGLRL